MNQITEFIKIVKNGGLSSAIQATQEYIHKRLAVYYGLKYQYFCSEELPVMMDVSAQDIEYRSSIHTSQIPTNDETSKKHNPPHNEPIVGILGGDWDKFKTDWFDNKISRSLKRRFIKGFSWEETEYYQMHKKKNLYNAEERCEDIDRLYESMKENGYIPQSILLDRNTDILTTVDPYTDSIRGEIFPNECRVGIGRNGEVIRFHSAQHRITIAKLLDLEEIPVIVVIRHKKWMGIRNIFKEAESIDEVPNEYKQYAGHPDLEDIHFLENSSN